MKQEYPDGTFYQGDCFDVMPQLASGSIDMVLVDLPYGTTECGWDSVLPFNQLWDEYWRLLKPTGTVVMTASQPFTTACIVSQIEYFKYELIWEKTKPTGFVHAKNKPLKKHENVLIFSKATTNHEHLTSSRMTYNPQGLKKILRPKVQDGTRKYGGHIGTRPSHRDYTPEYEGYPDSILRFDSNSSGFHPTQKPVDLFAYLIRTYSNEGEVILDNTAGAGTTAVAARQTNRKWVCIEADPEYFTKANERLVEQLDFE